MSATQQQIVPVTVFFWQETTPGDARKLSRRTVSVMPNNPIATLATRRTLNLAPDASLLDFQNLGEHHAPKPISMIVAKLRTIPADEAASRKSVDVVYFDIDKDRPASLVFVSMAKATFEKQLGDVVAKCLLTPEQTEATRDAKEVWARESSGRPWEEPSRRVF